MMMCQSLFATAGVAVIFCSVLCTAPTEGAEVSVPTTADTWIHGLESSSTSGGTGVRLSVCPSVDYWIYFKFDLSGIESVVSGAELRLKRDNGSRPDEISCYLINDDSWTEESLSGMTRPEPRSPAPGDSLAVGEKLADYDRWTSPSFVAAVAQEASGDGILTLMVREDRNDQLDVRNFRSREGASSATEAPTLVLTVSDEFVGEGWRTADVWFGTKPAIDFGSDGKLHVMGMTEERGGVVWHAVAEHPLGPFDPTVVASGYLYGPGDLVVDSLGTAHIAFHDHDRGDARHVTHKTNGLLIEHPNPSPSHNGWDNALAFDESGKLHMSSIDPAAFGAAQGLEYQVFDGAWSYEKLTMSDATCYGLSTDISIDDLGDPRIIYCSAGGFTEDGKLTYVYRDKSGWHFEDIVSGGPVGRFPSMALDHWFRPHVAWLDLDVDVDVNDTSFGTVRYAVRNNDAWEIETVDTLDHVQVGFSEARKSVALVLDADSRPLIAYGDKRTIRYARQPFADWEIETVVQRNADTYKSMVVLHLDSAGAPTVAFWQVSDLEAGLVRIASRAMTCEPEPCRSFVRGDCNGDGMVARVADVLSLLFFNFTGQPAPRCPAACDGNGDGDTGGVTDAVYLLTFRFFAGSPPVAPYPDCGPGELETDLSLGCQMSSLTCP